jgi:hypothetical protein
MKGYALINRRFSIAPMMECATWRQKALHIWMLERRHFEAFIPLVVPFLAAAGSRRDRS